ncbi:MAG: HAMP domain-containing histidine kinase [Mesorhizobium sp.]|uniref:ATP-binding protein n=1 Tax=Mesorhizobium sp. TaxID=1871066 RepID=UPI00121FAA92|nr:ATP-binding protein [Mesorhizobium sp.]TIO53903.1 MAG: HAMP domain-containing histidine kinase [Mesorhizobium sp.]TIO61530.1 MAG: HAMP domain-containing histidine kinase [Mesorhizobium sp.]TJV65916.1 MAG: HAMP domain-containing histidine kinase [Mesorhizobium sp.]
MANLIIAERRQAMLAVEICDQGAGMVPEMMDRAFEPYFTTRPNRGGTELGLAVLAMPARNDEPSAS